MAISVSESVDLERLGLSPKHLELTIAELSRAIVIAGGIVVYGGSINLGFTRIVLEEAEKYGRKSGAFEHLVPYTEHAELSHEQLTEYAAFLGVKSTVRLIDADGNPHAVDGSRSAAFARRDIQPAEALTDMRKLAASVADARIVLGGKVSGYLGSMPGVAEEAACTIREHKPIYVAGGFGGAATLVGALLNPNSYGWLPPNLPGRLTEETRQLVSDELDGELSDDGLTDDERALLAVTHRPSDIATLVVLGLSRCVQNSTGS